MQNITSCKIFDDDIRHFLRPRKSGKKIPLITSAEDTISNEKSCVKNVIKNKFEKNSNSNSDAKVINILPSKYSQKNPQFNVTTSYSNFSKTISSDEESMPELTKIKNNLPKSIHKIRNFKKKYPISQKSSDSENSNHVYTNSKFPTIKKNERRRPSKKTFQKKESKSSLTTPSVSQIHSNFLDISSTESDILELVQIDSAENSKPQYSTKYAVRNDSPSRFSALNSTQNKNNEVNKISEDKSVNSLYQESCINGHSLKEKDDNILENIPKLEMVNRKRQDKCISCLLKSANVIVKNKFKNFIPSKISKSESKDSLDLPLLMHLKHLDESVENSEFINTQEEKIDDEEITEIEPKKEEETSNTFESKLVRCPSKSIGSPQQSFDVLTEINIKESSDSSHPSGGGSESEQDEDFLEPKLLAPCHAPIILEPSLDPLYALMNRKFTSMEDRIKAQIIQQSQDSEDSGDNLHQPSCQSPKSDEGKSKESKSMNEKPKHILVRTKTVPQLQLDKNEQSRKVFTRSQTLFNISNDEESSGQEVSSDEKLANDKHVEAKSLTLQNLIDIIEKGRIITSDEILEFITSGFVNDGTNIDQLLHELDRYLQYVNDINEGSELVTNAFNLLTESRTYLGNRDISSNFNIENLRNIIPEETYNEVVAALHLPKYHSENLNENNYDIITKNKHDDFLDTDEEKFNFEAIKNKHFKKMGLLEVEDDNSLKLKADKIINEICKDFCQWLRNIGGPESSIDEDVLKDMFTINLKADAQKSMQDLLRKPVASPKVRSKLKKCDNISSTKITEQQFKKVDAINGQNKKVAFERSLSGGLRLATYYKNDYKEVESMDLLYNNLQHVHSYKEFVKWLNYTNENDELSHLRDMIRKRSKLSAQGGRKNCIK